MRIGPVLLFITALLIPAFSSPQMSFDLVILNGRVIDPESRTDAIRNLGISNGTIKAITTNNLVGATVIDAHGLVVSPGFIDLHQHGQDEENYRFKAMDGVTTALELEVGTGDVDGWYARRETSRVFPSATHSVCIESRIRQRLHRVANLLRDAASSP